MIVRGKHQSKFAVIPNHAANDTDLPLNARGLLVQLLTKPAQWSVSPQALAKENGINPQTCYNIINKLIEAGYIVREARRDSGKFTRWEYTVYDTPVAFEAATEADEDEPLLDLAEGDDTDEPRQNDDDACEVGELEETAENCGSPPVVEKPQVEKPQVEKPQVEKPFVENPHAYKEHTSIKHIDSSRARVETQKPTSGDPPPEGDPPEAIDEKPPIVRGVTLSDPAFEEALEQAAAAIIRWKGEPWWTSWLAYSHALPGDPWVFEVKSPYAATQINQQIGERLEQLLGSMVVFQANARRAPPAPPPDEKPKPGKRRKSKRNNGRPAA